MMAETARFIWLLLAAATIAQAIPLNSPPNESINEINNEDLQENPSGSKKQQRNSALPTNEFKENSTVRPGPFSWFLTPLVQKIQFSPQSFLQDRLVLLREALNNLGINVLQNVTAKQLLNGPGSLVHFLGPNDSGFYTNRLEPAGFLGGNGWFANKGGILGGPGAIVSTGGLLTDYPTPYRRK